jgi:hypothetical protein
MAELTVTVALLPVSGTYVMTADEAFLEAIASSITPWAADARAPRVWTDDRADLYGVLEFR